MEYTIPIAVVLLIGGVVLALHLYHEWKLHRQYRDIDADYDIWAMTYMGFSPEDIEDEYDRRKSAEVQGRLRDLFSRPRPGDDAYFGYDDVVAYSDGKKRRISGDDPAAFSDELGCDTWVFPPRVHSDRLYNYEDEQLREDYREWLIYPDEFPSR